MPKGKIVKALSGFYYVLAENKLYQCRGRGVFRKNKISPLVGDEVIFQAENEKEGYILEILQRKNELIRPPISNIDQGILVFSAVSPDFSAKLLDRFLVLMEAKNIRPIICITKMDLIADHVIDEKIRQFAKDYKKIGYPVFLMTTKEPETVKQVIPYLKDSISVIAGQSGVGKSSMLNCLDNRLQLKTGEISDHLGRGKHTTRHVELISLGGGLVADTPGFSSLEFTGIEAADLPNCFPEIKEFSIQCKFRGCLHQKEPKCAVKEAVENGDISTYRYEHYLQFLEEIKERKPRY
ncbi:ribosome small subunit-dependent GTPase A [Aeribacillus sp. FSL M8-0254]|uniref:ribosome small subunit-dependent GTPase A n=1 Tax=Aeribacillus sp. FSL M8-0254 TaxID=2954577 RepID=UPI0030FBFAE4